ncbi:MAG: sialate O-acetylesterase [Saprospiraceae bacterium]|jgi:sialate O-acetylesterase
MTMRILRFIYLFSFTIFLIGQSLQAQINMPSIFGDHMVLQQKQDNPVWGWANSGEKIAVSIDGQRHTTTADAKGNWRVQLKPIVVGGPYKLHIEGENAQFYFEDVMVGEVWICSGQSNMEWPIQRTNSAELAMLTANHPNIRLISVPRVGTQEAQNDFEGEWTTASSESIKDFSAIGYFFGRRLSDALDVPIGLIDNAWGGSAAEAWVKREVLEEDERFDEFMDSWTETERTFDYEKELEKWKEKVAEWESKPKAERSWRQPNRPRNILTGNNRPANIYNGVLHPTIGFGIKGVIWYQGESNARRAYQYRDLFPLMIKHWREEWQQGDFPFYYVQLADVQEESDEPGDSNWAELREAQTMTMDRLKNVGEAVIIDLGEGRDIHPRNKNTVADRLARWALAKDYKKEIQYRGPTYQSMEVMGSKIIIKFNNTGQGLYSFDTQEPQGFTIAGTNQKFVNAQAKMVDENTMEVWSDDINAPASVRYAWAQNPICNMYSRDGLPMTPFRTDDWQGITFGKNKR